MAYHGSQQSYNYAPNNRYQSPMPPGNPPIPPPYPPPSAQPYSPISPNTNQAPFGSHSPYPQSQSGYNRPPPPPPPGQPSPYPGQPPSPMYQQPYGQQNQYQQQQQQQQSPYGQQQPYQQQQSYGQNQYGQQPPYGNQYGQPPQGQPPQGQQYGAPPGQQQYGGPPPQQGPPGDASAYRQLLQSCIQEKHLQQFYPPNSPVVEQIAQRAPQLIGQVIQRWRIPKEIANDVVKLALYDIVLYIDDSGSMAFEENGERIKDMRLILERVSFAATLFDADGISVRFMNTNLPPNVQDGVSTEAHIENIMRGVQFKGLTPMGTSLRKKVVDEVIGKARAGQLRKPVLVITVTDGQPAGEPQTAVFDTIRDAVNALPPGGIAFEFAQVGNDQSARSFLGKLDEDPQIGKLVDCTSNFENEQEEMARAVPPVDLTPDQWILKLLLGAIDSSYDTKDEKTNQAPGGYGGGPQYTYGQAPPGQQGYPPQGQPQYGAPPPGQQYGAPPPGQYGAPPPQQGYGQRPPQGQYPPQGQGQPYPAQGGYPGQPQYNAPPPAGRH